MSDRLLSPALFFGEMGYRKVGAMLGSTRLQNALHWQLVDGWTHTRELLVWILGLSGLFALIAFFQARKAHFAGRSVLAWTAFVFAFNLAGLIVFRLVADWPRQTTCPHCRKPRPIDRSHCPSCNSGWEPAETRGTEIIDTVSASAGQAQTTTHP